MNSLRMKTVLLSLFYLLMWCQATDSLIDQQVILGESVTLDCGVDVKEIFWVFLKLPDPPVVILRSFMSEHTSAQFFDAKLRNKYSLKTQSRLVIINVSVDELGLYYCIKQTTPLQISIGTRIYTTEPAQDQNETEEKNQPQHQTTHQIVTLIYIIMNIVLFAAITVVLKISHNLSKKSAQYQNIKEEEFYHSGEQYSEVEFRLCHKLIKSCSTIVHFSAEISDEKLDEHNQQYRPSHNL